MKSVSLFHTVKAVAKKVVPYPVRRWIRDREHRLVLKKHELKDRFIVRRKQFRNREGLLNFDFSLIGKRRRNGVSALLRVKNEASKIYYCLSSIRDVFDEIVIVDNGSEDKTLKIIQEFQRLEDKDGKIKVYFYPHKIARCGAEHFNTPANSVHNLSYFSNWSLSYCSLSYVCKWDGDMVLKKEIKEPFKRFLRQIQKGPRVCWVLFGQTVYRDLEGKYCLFKDEVNGEIMVFPNGLNPRFHKVDLYEMLKSEPPLDVRKFDGVAFYELKFVDEDEFAHWSTTNFPTDRKRREWNNFHLICKGGVLPKDRFDRLPSDFFGKLRD